MHDNILDSARPYICHHALEAGPVGILPGDTGVLVDLNEVIRDVEHDPLTGLYTRSFFQEYCRRLLAAQDGHRRDMIAVDGDRFRRWAETIGSNTVAVVQHFLSMYKIEQQGYKACMALLKLIKSSEEADDAN